MIGYSVLRKSGGKNSELKEKTNAFHLRCREAGLRITPQRTAIYKALLESGEHPSAEMVFRKVREVFPGISLDTVNRTLLTSSEIDAAFAAGVGVMQRGLTGIWRAISILNT